MRTYQTAMQRYVPLVVAAIVLVASVISAAHAPSLAGRAYIAGLAILVAIVGVRFARCRVIAGDEGVRVVNLKNTLDLRWDEIEHFEVARFGACPIRLKNGRTVLMTGIQQKNISGMLDTQDTPERQMIDELNAVLAERQGEGRPRRGPIIATARRRAAAAPAG